MRTIRKIIIHCSATEAGRNFTVSDIRSWHQQQGWSDVGYHYVILLNGTVQQGRAEHTIGAHCKGQNRDSIGICYIGGLLDGHPADTRTEAQNTALVGLLHDILKRYPQATIHGHNAFAQKACPCFDVDTWRKEVGL